MTKLGTLITTDADRDAVHVAVVPIKAQVVLIPGQRVNKDGLPLGSPVGIVDPFLTDVVKPGQTFFLCLFPETVTGMTHRWSHPAFDGRPEPGEVAPPSGKSASRAWIDDFAGQFNMTGDALIAAAREVQRGGWAITQYGGQDWQDNFDNRRAEFWQHYAAVTGEAVRETDANVFSCSC